MIEFTATPYPDDNEIRVVKLSGKLDNDSSDYFFSCVEDQIRDGHKQIILDCSNLSYISSMGLGSLMRIHSRMKKHGGDVKVAAMQSVVAEAFRIVGFERILNLYETVDDASEAFI